LLIEHDSSTVETVERTLQTAGHVVWTSSSGAEGLEFLTYGRADAVIVALHLQDMLAFDLLRMLRRRLKLPVPVIVMAHGNVRDVLAAIRLGATDFVKKPIVEERLRNVLECALSGARADVPVIECEEEQERCTPHPHAATRWANAVVPIIDCPGDPRTITGWSRCIAASPGAIRNWCFTAGIGPRRSLVFGRLLRAVVLSQGGRHKPENLLDVVDRRTLHGLMRLAGFDSQHLFPTQPEDYLLRQILVRDAEALLQVERALCDRRQNVNVASQSA
jgi:CheY-like chemotaxis protein